MTKKEATYAAHLAGRMTTAVRRLKILLGCVLAAMLMAVAPMAHAQDVGMAVFNHRIMVGMTYGNVLASWGRPYDVNRSISSYGVTERWCIWTTAG
jgi:hypothetical protein